MWWDHNKDLMKLKHLMEIKNEESFYEKTCKKCMYSGKAEDEFRINVGLKVNEKSYFCPTCNKSTRSNLGYIAGGITMNLDIY